VYVYTVNVRDQSGNHASDQVTVHIYDDEAPEVRFIMDEIWVDPSNPGAVPYTYIYMQDNHSGLVDRIVDNFDELEANEYTFSALPYSLSTVGVYELNYHVVAVFGNAGVSTVTIYVYEEVEPEIQMLSSVITVDQGDEVDFFDYILQITDNYEGFIPVERATIVSYGGYDKDVPGEYFIRFSVFDVFGNEDRSTLKVTVVE
jgi:hypothetical protein